MTQTNKPKKKLSLQEKVVLYEKQLYDYRQLLEMSKSLSSVLEIDTLIESILYVCMCQMRVLGTGVFILKSFDADFFALDSNYNGLELIDTISYLIPTTHPLIPFLAENNRTYTYEELESCFKDTSILEQISSLKPSLIIPLKQKNHLNGILLLGERIDVGEGVAYSDYEREQMLDIASISAIAINNASLIEMTTTDMMTRLKLKHYFYTILAEKLDFSFENRLPLGVLMLDIDHFKKFNDTYGHACGDYVLQQVAKKIFEGIRGQDMAGRYGGEEFVVMLYNTEKDAAMLVAERIRKDIEHAELHYEGKDLSVTISIGVAFCPPETSMTAKEIVEFADQALYESKANGRNRVTLAQTYKDNAFAGEK
ncbi:MAG TPA: GGDEF domain-containing protein [Treponema sp.]|nr:GGDEF domain-containing protein [Treponema sp.]